MRKTHLKSTLLAACFLPVSTLAFADCGPGCGGETPSYGTGSLAGGSSSIVYGSSPVYSSSSSTYHARSSSPCPSGSSRASDGACIVNGPSRSVGYSSSFSSSTGWSSHSSYQAPSVSVYEGASSYSAPVSYTSSSYTSTYATAPSYGAYRASASSSTTTAPCPAGSHREGGVCMTDSTGTIYASTTERVSVVPFTEPTIRATRLLGLGSNESLVPTSCPTSVYNPEGAEVLGCYSIAKPEPVYVQPSYHMVQVVHPIIYVRYPVPTPYAVPVATPTCRIGYRRYGRNWPGRCGW